MINIYRRYDVVPSRDEYNLGEAVYYELPRDVVPRNRTREHVTIWVIDHQVHIIMDRTKPTVLSWDKFKQLIDEHAALHRDDKEIANEQWQELMQEVEGA